MARGERYHPKCVACAVASGAIEFHTRKIKSRSCRRPAHGGAHDVRARWIKRDCTPNLEVEVCLLFFQGIDEGAQSARALGPIDPPLCVFAGCVHTTI